MKRLTLVVDNQQGSASLAQVAQAMAAEGGEQAPELGQAKLLHGRWRGSQNRQAPRDGIYLSPLMEYQNEVFKER